MRRVGELDSVRGIAALIVVFHHCTNALFERWNFPLFTGVGLLHPHSLVGLGAWFLATPLRLVIAGPSAVSIFFVLSGFVLTLPIVSHRQPPYRDYLIKRFFRLYIPFATAVLLAAALCRATLAGPVSELDGWFNESWDEPLTWQLVLGHLLIPGVDRFQSLDDPIWSLVHEMRISLVFPLLAMFAIARPRMAIGSGVLAYFVLTALKKYGLVHIEAPLLRDIAGSFAGSAQLALFFVVGAALAAHFDAVKARFAGMPGFARIGLWCVSAVLLSIPDYYISYTLFFFGSLAGAVLLLALCLTSVQAQTLLAHAPARWLGRVSYSLYLIHLVVILALAHAFHARVSAGLLVVSAVPMALLAAEVMYRCIELPSQNLGRQLAARTAGKAPQAVHSQILVPVAQSVAQGARDDSRRLRRPQHGDPKGHNTL
jgi:peptidoglycan/LPS O-acetylase OafA/YrhL